MARVWGTKRFGPIGVDVGSRSVKLLQLTGDHNTVAESGHWDLPNVRADDPAKREEQIGEAICHAMEGRRFRGRDAVLCLGADNLFVQNIRVPVCNGDELRKVVQSDAAGRLPFASEEAEIRFLEAGDVRQGETFRREVILLACQRSSVQRIIGIAEAAGLRPAAIDVEPAAMLRSYLRQFRRENDQQRRMMFVNLGASTTRVVIGRGPDALFVKYIDVGGRHLDEAVARHLGMSLHDASSLRRHNGDRRADQRDPEVARSVQEATRPVLDRLANELALCLRYYSVTFRGQPLSHVVLGGGEATESLVEWLAGRLDTPCELGDPLRAYEKPAMAGRVSQWDVAAGLALRELN